MDRRLTGAAALAAAVLVLAGCDGDADGPSSGPSSPGTPTPTAAASATPTEMPMAPLLPGRLMYSQFDESVHTFQDTFIARTDGSQRRVVTLPGPEGGGGWSPDGRLVAVMTLRDDGRVGTAIIRPDGGVERVLDIPDATLNLVCVVWSPDGLRLACEGWDDNDPARRGIYSVLATTGAGLLRLTDPPGELGDFPGSFSPDGSTLVFKRSPDETSGPLMTVTAHGGAASRLTRVPVDDEGRYSPDGRSILSSRQGQLVVFRADGSLLRAIPGAGAFLFGPVWSPDGRYIAYSRSVSGPYADIWIARPDGSHALPATFSAENEIALDWGR